MINKKAVGIMSNQPIDFESAEFALRQSWEIHRQAFGVNVNEYLSQVLANI
jgi:hypothetical protein